MAVGALEITGGPRSSRLCCCSCVASLDLIRPVGKRQTEAQSRLRGKVLKEYKTIELTSSWKRLVVFNNVHHVGIHVRGSDDYIEGLAFQVGSIYRQDT